MRYGIQRQATGVMWPETYVHREAADTQKILLGSLWTVMEIREIQDNITKHNDAMGLSCMCEKCSNIRKGMAPIPREAFKDKVKLKCVVCQQPIYLESASVMYEKKHYHTYCLYREKVHE